MIKPNLFEAGCIMIGAPLGVYLIACVSDLEFVAPAGMFLFFIGVVGSILVFASKCANSKKPRE